MTVRNIKKSLAGVEDLAIGIGKLQQERGVVHRVNVFPSSHSYIDMQQYEGGDFFRLYGSDVSYTDYRRNPTGTVGIPAGAGGVWEPLTGNDKIIGGNTIDGAYLVDENYLVWHAASSSNYAWSGAFPKIVAAGATLAPLGSGGWIDHSDVALRGELAATDGATLSLSQIATTYGIDFNSLSVFAPGASYDVGNFIYYDNSVWEPNSDSTVASSISYSDFHRVPKSGERWSPEMFGAVGDGVAADDDAFKRMVSFLPEESVVWLTSGVSYYFNIPGGHVNNIILNKPITIIGFGVKIIRRASNSATNDANMAVFNITGNRVKIIGKIDFNGSEPEARITQVGGGYHPDTREYASCIASSHLILVNGSPDGVVIDGPTLHHSCFNIWVNGAANIKIDVTAYKSGQVLPLTGSDMQLGAGVKLSNLVGFDVKVNGYYNTNASLEIEPSCVNGRVSLLSDSDFWSGLTCTNNTNLYVDAVISNPGRYGAQIVNGNRVLRGRIQINGGADTAGLLLGMFDAGVNARDSYGIDIDLIVDGITGRPVEISKTAGVAACRGYKINLAAENVTSDYAVYCQSNAGGVITGYAAGTCIAVAFNGCEEVTTLRDFDASRCSGTYYAVTSPKFALENVTTHDGKKVTALYQNVATLGKSSTATGGLETIEALGSYNLFTGLMQAPYLQTTDTFVAVGGLWVNGGVVTRK